MVLCVAQGIEMNKVLAVTLVIMMTACGYDNDVVTIEAPAEEQCKPGHGRALGHRDAGVDAGIVEAEDAGVPDGCL